MSKNKLLNELDNFMFTQLQKIEIEKLYKECIYIIIKLLMEFIFLTQDLDDKSIEYENCVNDIFENRKYENQINNNSHFSDIENEKTEEIKIINQKFENGKYPNEIIEEFDNEKNENCEVTNEDKNNNNSNKSKSHENESIKNEQTENCEIDNKKGNEISENNENSLINPIGKNLNEVDKKYNNKCIINEDNENDKKQVINLNDENKSENNDNECEGMQKDEKKKELKSDEKEKLEEINEDIEEKNFEDKDKIEIKCESENEKKRKFENQFFELKIKESLKKNIDALKNFVVEYLKETEKNYNKKINEIANNNLDKLNNKILLLRFDLAAEYPGLFNPSSSKIDLKEELKKFISDTFYKKNELTLLKNSIIFLIELLFKKFTEYFKNLYLQEISKQKDHLIDIIKSNNIKIQDQIKKYNEIMENDSQKVEEISAPIEKKDLSIVETIKKLRNSDSESNSEEND